MAFANLFTGLSAVEDDVRSPGQPTVTHRYETKTGKRGNARKRKTQGEQTEPPVRKRFYQAQTTRTYSTPENDSKAIQYHMHSTEGERASVFTSSCSENARHNNMCHKGQTKSNRKSKQQEKKREPERWKNQHQQKDRWRPAHKDGSLQKRKGGGDWKNKNNKQDFQVKFPRFMTQEFKDQNVIMVDGQLLCRHFLWGRCIKGDDCQLKHVQGYNGLIKEACKFYIQGFCTKGETCVYMHKSFPCKFFHRKGKCSQGADCRFSHEPLNDVTKRLLDEALKRDLHFNELAKKAEQEVSGLSANTDETETIEANRTPDVLLPPLRPNFYKSADTDAEDALLCQTEEQADNMEEPVSSHASDAAQPDCPPSTNLSHEEPVCYSVEAVLGPQLSKPFTGFFTTQRSQESTPVSSSDCTASSANQSQVPYSVDAVLRSYKSAENSTFGQTPSPSTAQTVSHTPEITDPLLNSETQHNRISYSEKMFKSLPSFQVHTSLISKTCANKTLASKDEKTQGGDMSESQKPAQRASGEVESELSPQPMSNASSLNCISEGVLPFGPMNSPSQTSTFKLPAQLKPHLSVLTSGSQASFKPFCPPGITEFKGSAAVCTEPISSPVQSSDPAAKQHTDVHQPYKKAQAGLNLGIKQHDSIETTTQCSTAVSHCGDLAAGCKKTLRRPFRSLFANPITDALQPLDSLATSSSCAHGSVQSSCTAPQSADCRSDRLKTVLESDKAPVSSFLSLFAAPLPCVQSQLDSQQSVQAVVNTSYSSDSKQRTLELEAPIPHQVRTDVKDSSHALRAPNVSPDAKIGKDSSTEHINLPTKQLADPVCSLVSDSPSETSTSPTCGNSPPTSHTCQHLPNVSSHKVLKTLFVCLSPYQQDEEQQDTIQIAVPSESEKDKSGMGCVFVKQQQKSEKKGRRRKKQLETQHSHKQSIETTAADRGEPRLPLQTPQISLEATGGSTRSSPGMTKPQVATLKHTVEEGKQVKGNEATTPLKDLFKTLDAVFH